MGRRAGTYPGFFYSRVMVDKGEADLIWTLETVSQFIANPRKYLPGSKMSFAGMKSSEDRANLLAYLRSLSPDYVPPVK